MMTRKILFLFENEVGTEKNEKGKLIRGVVKFAHLIGQCQSIAISLCSSSGLKISRAKEPKFQGILALMTIITGVACYFCSYVN